MRGRFTSFLVFLGLFFSIAVMPAIAHADDHTSAEAGLTIDAHENEGSKHSQPAGDDSEMPCHAVSHHHCSIALQLDAPRIGLNSPSRSSLLRPGSTAPLFSHSQAPPLDPPNA